MNPLFKRVGNNIPGRSLFNLSYEKKFSCDMAQLIPVMCDEVVPGDIFEIGANAIIRAQPLVAPVLHAVDMYVHTFFVPYRLLWEDWEDFITGGPAGTLTPVMPVWEPVTDAEVAVGSLWDFMGFPTFATVPTSVTDTWPIDMPRRAYAFIFNEYYRDETLQTEIDYDPITVPIDLPLIRNWEKDYFTSSLISQQRGPAPAFPIVGTTHAVWDGADIINSGGLGQWASPTAAPTTPQLFVNDANGRVNALNFLNSNDVDLSAATPLDIANMRLGFQIQRWLELNSRAGVRYTEFLHAHFGVSPNDSRLDRPEYIGGMKAPIIFTEVLQTSETDTTPQGNLAGHGLSVSSEVIGKYRVEEYGLIMSIMSIMPRPAYQQGINRQWMRKTKFDFYFPEFAHISEQAILQQEIYWTDSDTANQTPFGFCGNYDEMRTKPSMVCSDFRTLYDYWHLGRKFSSAPVLDNTFITCVPRKDIFAVPSEPGFLVQFGNIIKALRPMPIIAEPGLIDHVYGGR
ncbi:MAG: major capsid protein [Arizlama microvirus]|nr:MAG: major capsid protein [Arizlama microvirus]